VTFGLEDFVACECRTPWGARRRLGKVKEAIESENWRKLKSQELRALVAAGGPDSLVHIRVEKLGSLRHALLVNRLQETPYRPPGKRRSA
jgi:hypothetical protein